VGNPNLAPLPRGPIIPLYRGQKTPESGSPTTPKRSSPEPIPGATDFQSRYHRHSRYHRLPKVGTTDILGTSNFQVRGLSPEPKVGASYFQSRYHRHSRYHRLPKVGTTNIVSLRDICLQKEIPVPPTSKVGATDILGTSDFPKVRTSDFHGVNSFPVLDHIHSLSHSP
jgi:hypothetical protein